MEMSDSRCSDCDTPQPPADVQPTSPCTVCGSTRRTVHVRLADTEVVSDHFQAVASQGDEVIAFVETYRPRYTRHASLEADGTIRLSLAGIPPRNEEDSEDVAELLLAHLAATGEHLAICDRHRADDDFVLALNCASGPRISMQVVRALSDRAFWSRLSRDANRVDLRLTPAEASQAVAYAIWHKGHPGGVPPHQRRNMILALDALRILPSRCQS